MMYFYLFTKLDIVIETNLAAIKALEAVHKKLFRYGNSRYDFIKQSSCFDEMVLIFCF